MRKATGGLLLVLLAAGCSSHGGSTPTRALATKPRHRRNPDPRQLLVSPLGLPRVHSRIVPGYVLIADRNNNRALIVSPSKRIVWQNDTLRGPDDAFFTPGYRSVITNEEFNDTLVELSLKGQRRLWSYGHSGVAGSSPGYLNTPDDAYRLPSGITTVADIRNCRIVQLSRGGRVVRVLGGSCVHDPPRGFASPNGDTPLPDGGMLVTEIGGWIDRLGPAGNLLWAIRSPVPYPSDAQLLPDGQVLVASFAIPGRIVIVGPQRRDHVVVRLCKRVESTRQALARGPLAERPHRRQRRLQPPRDRDRPAEQADRLAVRPHRDRRQRPRLPEQARRDRPSARDLPGACLGRGDEARGARRRLRVRRIGTLPQAVSRLAAVALADGRHAVYALG